MPEHPAVSVIVPAFNEEQTLAPLATRLVEVLGADGRPFEIVFVNDGSTDGSGVILDGLQSDAPARIRVIHLRRNFGKGEALLRGFREAQGEILITMDADLQDDPGEIPRFLGRLAEGYDLVSGWKVERQDPWTKRMSSRLFNAVTARLTGIPLRDVNCGFKCYRRAVVEELDLRGRLYRFAPVLAAARGFRVGELPVRHHPRRAGRSKFGWTRSIEGFLDLLTVLLLTKYAQRPLHFLGLPGIILGTIGLTICGYLIGLWFAGVRPIGTRPLLTFGVLAVILGIQFLSIGLLGEMLATHMRRHHPSAPGRSALERQAVDPTEVTR